MNIKYITNVRIPTSRAYGYAIMKMCNEFSNAGIQTTLFVPTRGNNDNKENPFDYYRMEKNFVIKKIPSLDLLATTLKFGRLFYWVDILSFLISTKLNVKMNEDDVLYTRDFITTLFFSKKNFIALELHDIPTSKFLFKIAIKKAKIFFVLNTYLKQDLVSMGVDPKNIFISPSGVDILEENTISKEELRNVLGLPQQKNIVLYSGQFYSWKGVDTLAEAAKLSPENLFVFVGGAEPEFQSFSKMYGGVSNIKIVEFQPKEKSLQYMLASDVLVIPNSGKSKISSMYTSPLKLFEYMTSKKPIVASDLLSIREILDDNDCVFAKPDSPESFAEAIRKVLSDYHLAESISLNAYNKVGKYSWQNRVKKILENISHTKL